MRKTNLAAMAVALTTLMVSSCGNDEICVRNVTQTCVCPNGVTGAQVCSDDQQGWDACICNGAAGDAGASDVAVGGSDGPSGTDAGDDDAGDDGTGASDAGDDGTSTTDTVDDDASSTDMGADADAEADTAVSCEPNPNRRLGELVLTQNTERSDITASFGFEENVAACASTTETFGDCTVRTDRYPECGDDCGGGTCAWGDGCTPTCQCYEPGTTPICEPACESYQWCVLDATCLATLCYGDVHLDAGTIVITGGTGQGTVTGTWNSDLARYQWDREVSDAWWVAGDDLHIEASGDAFPAFSMDVTAPPVIDVNTEGWDQSTFNGSNDVDMTWTPGVGEIRITMSSYMSHTLTCITADDGSFQIPSSAIAAMGGDPIDFRISLSRVQREATDVCEDGQATVTIHSHQPVSVD